MRLKRTVDEIGLPFDGNGHQSEDASANGDDGDKLRDFTVNPAKGPIVGDHTDEIKDDVERGNHGISDRQINLSYVHGLKLVTDDSCDFAFKTDYQEVVRNGAHSPVSEHDPNDNQIATSANDDHDSKEHRPENNPPPW